MKVIDRAALDTESNSPVKQQVNTIAKRQPNKHFLLQQAHYNNSQTEAEILSHPIIKEVMQTSHLNTIRHDINRIHTQTSLYAQPRPHKHDEYRFDSIPPRNRMYSSLCSGKIQQIDAGLRETQHSSKRSISVASKKSINDSGLKGKVVVERQENVKNAKVSVSGLVTYNFKSVNPQRSLGFNKLNHDEKMIQQEAQFDRRKYCSTRRTRKILLATSKQRYNRAVLTDKSIFANSELSTEAYLYQIRKDQHLNDLIYEEKAKKLTFIKEYMQQEKVSYEEAAYIVDQIEGNGKAEPIEKKPKEKVEINEDREITLRRLPIKKRVVCIRHLTFVD